MKWQYKVIVTLVVVVVLFLLYPYIKDFAATVPF